MLGGQPLGGEAELDDRPGLDQPGHGQLPGQVVGVGERVDEVDLVPDDQGRGGDGVPFLVGRGDGAGQQAVEDGRRLLRVEGDRVLDHAVEGPIFVGGSRLANQATARATGAA